MYSIKFVKLHPSAIMPEHSFEGDAGMDLFSIDETVIKSHEFCLVHTGIAIELPTNTEAQIRPRSGLALNYGITVLNTPGTIDQGYRGELGVILINHSNTDFAVKKRMRIAQMVIKPVYTVELIEVEELSDSNRGEKGFGSSGITKLENIL